jgi:hypothetical protein
MLGFLHFAGGATRIGDLARSARQLAGALTRDADKERLCQHADELEAQAKSLEAAAKPHEGSQRFEALP